MYANDTTLFNSIDKTTSPLQRQKLCETLNKDLKTIQEWGSQWLVSFNPSKTKSSSLSLKRLLIAPVSSHVWQPY